MNTMIIHNKTIRHRASLAAFYHTMMNDPDLYIDLYYQATGHSEDYIPTRLELSNELIKYKIFKFWKPKQRQVI